MIIVWWGLTRDFSLSLLLLRCRPKKYIDCVRVKMWAIYFCCFWKITPSYIYWVSCMYIGIAYCYLKWKLFLPTHSVYHISRWGQPASIIKSFTCTLCCQFDKSNIWVHIMKQQFRSLKAHLLAKYHTKLHKDTPVYFRDLLQTSLWPILFFIFQPAH